MSLRFITELHNQLRMTRMIKDVPFVRGKSYPRFEQIKLPALEPLPSTLSEVLQNRVSCSSPMNESPLSIDQLSQILGHSMKIRADGHRPHPSGGARYPLEAYILPFNVSGVTPKAFHYNPTTHSLEHLWDFPADAKPYDFIFDQEDHCKNAGALIIFTACWERSSMRYSNFTYTVGLMESGHIMQNILLIATALRIPSRPFAGFKENALVPLLDLDSQQEQVVYAVALGS